MAYNSQQLVSNPFTVLLNNMTTNRATLQPNSGRIDSTVFLNSTYLSENPNPNQYLNRNPNPKPNPNLTASAHLPLVAKSTYGPTSECNCDKEFVDFCKMHSISHSECLAAKQVRCELCSTTADYKSIQWHIQSEKHRQRHKQLMEYVFLLSIPLYSKGQALRISQVLESSYKTNALNKSDIDRRLAIVDEINELMRTHGLNDYSVRLYGSTINGFGLKKSDINIDIVPNPSESVDKSENTVNTSVAIILSQISSLIEKKSKNFFRVRNEYNIKVPKVRFDDKRSGLEVELSITVQKSFLSSKLLQQYCQIDNRVTILGCALREWARTYYFDDQENGLWPAFTFPILVIHFLQRCSPPVLPCLHELLPKDKSKTEPNAANALNAVNAVNPKVQNPNPIHSSNRQSLDDNDGADEYFNLSSLDWMTTNDKSVGELWLEMLRYYAVEFDAETYVVSIRSTTAPQMRADKHWSTRMLAVEDPTRPSLNLSRSVGSMRLYNVFVEQLRHTFKYFAIPFINVMSNNSYNNLRASPLFTERDFEVLVNQTQHYDNINVNDLLAQINCVNSESDLESNEKTNRGSDESDSEDESKRKENFHIKSARILKTFGIRMKLTPEIESTLQLIPTTQLNYSFHLNKMPFFQRPPKFCRMCHRYSHQQDRCPESQLPPLKALPALLDQNYDKMLSQICYQIFEAKKMDENDERIQSKILTDLENYIRNQIPNAKLELFGSTKNGFGARHCDLDICLTFEDNPTGKELEFEKIIESVGQILKPHERLRHITPIVSAKVPIVKFAYILDKFRCVECDISLYNILARYNTALLRAYTLIDPRVQVLGFVAKHFAKTCDMCDASRGSLSSYAYSLMTIHFLQKRGIIPVLQEIGLESKFEREVDGWETWFYDDLKQLASHWKPKPNNESIAQLFIGFLKYYSEEFNFDENIVCCRQSAPLKRLEKMWTGSKIAIEDPFLLSHNLGAGVSPQMAIFIRTSFVLGRNLFGSPPMAGLDPRFRSWTEYFFNRHHLTRGLPPTGRGCRVCGKIGHKQNKCPERMERHDRPERQERHNKPEKSRKPDKKQNRRKNN